MAKKCCGKWKKKGKYCGSCPVKIAKKDAVDALKVKKAKKKNSDSKKDKDSDKKDKKHKKDKSHKKDKKHKK